MGGDVESAPGGRWSGFDADSLESLCVDRDASKLGDPNHVVRALGSSATEGLDPATVEERRAVFGENTHKRPPGASYLDLVWEQLKDPMIMLLIAAAAVSTILGAALPEQREEKAYADGIAIWVAVLVVVSIGAGNDYHKELQFRKLNAAKDILQTKVVRNGQNIVIPSTELVVGDLMLLDTGDKIAADGILVEPYRSIHLDESSLTGESDAVHKTKEAPFIISGSQVVEGEGRMLVMAVGKRTEWGRLIALTTGETENTPLQDKLAIVASLVAKVGLSVAIACFIVLFIFLCAEIRGFPTTGRHWMEVLDFFLYAVTIIVVAVPEGLPLAVTISLAYSMRKMMKDNNFVRHLSACETMGGATCICTDKTGTLTENRMTVVEAWIAQAPIPRPPAIDDISNKYLLELLCNGISANTKAFLVEKDDGLELVGNRTECALILMLKSLDIDYRSIRDAARIEAVGTFTAQRKMSSVLVKQEDTGTSECFCLHAKGAAEIVLGRCSGAMNPSGNVVPFSTNGDGRTRLEELITSMASRGLRTLAIAVRQNLSSDAKAVPITDLEEDLTLVAILGIKDPVRATVPYTIEVCKEAGITVKMVTGDNLYTAKHIARECGILSPEGLALDGPTFRTMPDKQLIPLLPKLEVLARSSPEDKYKLVSLLRAQGEVVAVTGDGTNDAPALKEADVGLAMGIAGTDVAKEASDIVILDDNFASIVKAVLWGRSIFGNLRKFLQFQLTVNVVALYTAFIAAVTGKGEPLNVLQLLWVNMLMDSLAALALATENPTPDLLKQQPHGRREPLLTPMMQYHILVQSLYQAGWLMFILYGLPEIGIEMYERPCEMSCAEWTGGGDCLIKSAKNSDAPLCSNKNALEKQNEDAIHGQHQAINSILFNTFIFMQLFNEVSSRKLGQEINVFSGILKNNVFIVVLVVTVALQVIIMETPFARVFKVTSQTWEEWIFAICVGAGSMAACLLGKLIARVWFAKRDQQGASASQSSSPAVVCDSCPASLRRIDMDMPEISVKSQPVKSPADPAAVSIKSASA